MSTSHRRTGTSAATDPPDPLRLDALGRLRTARGHLEAVARMMEDGRDCAELLHQLKAVTGAIDGVRRTILQNHVRMCLAETIRAESVDHALADLAAMLAGASPDPVRPSRTGLPAEPGNRRPPEVPVERTERPGSGVRADMSSPPPSPS